MSDSAILKTLKFSTFKKTSQYADSSWEIGTKSGNKYRFKAENPDQNEKWYSLVKAILDPSIKELNISSSHDKIVSSTADEAVDG